MQSFDRSTFKVFSRRGLFWPAFLASSRHLLAYFLFTSPFFLAAQSLPTQKEGISPRSDSSQVWLQAIPEADSSFRLRAYFISSKKYPRYLYWRSQIVRGFDKKRESGDFVALPKDSALVWEGHFLLEKSDPRSVNFYVIDNDLIVASTEVHFASLNLNFIQKEARPIDITDSPTGVSVEKIAENPSGLTNEAKVSGAQTNAMGHEPNPKPTEPISTKTEPATTVVEAKPALPKPKLNLAKDDFEIDGILTSDVRTNFGRQFYAFFQEKWIAPEKVGGYWVSIREILTPGRYTLIAVSLNNRELFRQYLNPNQNYLKDLAGQTVDLLTNILKSGDPDGGFTNEDLNGIGVE